jgi:hypothetical protein
MPASIRSGPWRPRHPHDARRDRAEQDALDGTGLTRADDREVVVGRRLDDHVDGGTLGHQRLAAVGLRDALEQGAQRGLVLRRWVARSREEKVYPGARVGGPARRFVDNEFRFRAPKVDAGEHPHAILRGRYTRRPPRPEQDHRVADGCSRRGPIS